MNKKLVYSFGGGQADGRADMKNLLGGKGANLAEMASLGIPVPAGFTITTEVCTHFYQNNNAYPTGLETQVKAGISQMEKIMGAKFNDPDNPLLVSVRSGARVSMPGMMDTVLNLGLNPNTIQGLIKKSNNNERFAWDCYRRFVQMYGDVVLGLKPKNKQEQDPFEKIIEEVKDQKGIKEDTQLTTGDLKSIVEQFKAIVRERQAVEIPDDPWEQLWGGIAAVFKSWNTPRAIEYRRIHKISDDWGTATNVQSMVYGNMGADCATGVAFTRDPATGQKQFYGEFLFNAQGEDVVAGTRTPQQINASGRDALPEGNPSKELETLQKIMPALYRQLDNIQTKLESHYQNMQDIEFTIQQGKLWMLQTRNGKRTGRAAIKIAVDMVKERMLDQKAAILRVEPEQLDQLLHRQFDPKAEKNKIAKGLPASPGAAVGKVVFFADEAKKIGKDEKVILVRLETSPEDIGGMAAAQGIVTARGGMTSHAAVVARGMDTPAVVGCGALVIDYEKRQFTAGETLVRENDWISIDGSSGEVMLGQIPTVETQITDEFKTFMQWVDNFRKISVRTNADTPEDVKKALEYGAEGIGLCRTEHMFFGGERIKTVREMILADDEAGRRKALGKLLPMQRQDFIEIFRLMTDKPVTIRLLDPPLHEFLPQTDEDIAAMASEMQVPPEVIRARVSSLHETNPMLGHRGCRLGMTYPEITEMQTQAIMEAACIVKKEGIQVHPEIMVPLIGTVMEIKEQKAIIVRVAEAVTADRGIKVPYLVGTMIEIPRAALLADKIAKEAAFFSFGTNDLTQMCFGYSRDDAGKFLPEYIAKGVLTNDPFQQLDQEGVGQLIKMGIERGRATNPDLKIGICGEHGGDPASVEFCHRIGMNYVSCSPPRVPIARLAAAQAALKENPEP
ncbi:pyruvate, phosphate dikinase [Patescibacteria group bacterium]|nr:pyruvate, phosphate dikinase [Patescibacteria group bacterium]MBU4512033.1 pyruvate, phosphate dikinase [Patescibacteria group bacterium]MCG2693190.1 pyruvate, phosphate dikinase [Candidatus Parcubacteria bacterium]